MVPAPGPSRAPGSSPRSGRGTAGSRPPGHARRGPPAWRSPAARTSCPVGEGGRLEGEHLGPVRLADHLERHPGPSRLLGHPGRGLAAAQVTDEVDHRVVPAPAAGGEEADRGRQVVRHPGPEIVLPAAAETDRAGTQGAEPFERGPEQAAANPPPLGGGVHEQQRPDRSEGHLPEPLQCLAVAGGIQRTEGDAVRHGRTMAASGSRRTRFRNRQVRRWAVERLVALRQPPRSEAPTSPGPACPRPRRGRRS